jgi:hypothetical protein
VTAIQTGGGGAAGLDGNIGWYSLGFLALILAGGLGWTAIRPQLKRK